MGHLDDRAPRYGGAQRQAGQLQLVVAFLHCIFVACIIILANPLPAIAAVGVGAAPFEVQEYKKDFGVSTEIAERNLNLQQQGAGIVELLKAIEGKGYAGVWFDNQKGEFVIPLLPTAPSSTIASALEGIELKGDFRTESVKYSWQELESTQEVLGKVLHGPRFNGQALSQTSIDPRTNAVVVEVSQSANDTQLAEIETQAGKEPADIEVKQAGTAGSVNQSKTGCLNQKEQYACSTPLRGGVTIGLLAEGKKEHYLSQCTAGFKALGNTYGNRFIVTAGHCSEAESKEFFKTDHTWYAQTYEGGVLTEKSIGGPMEAVHYPKEDWGAIKANGSFWDTSQWPTESENWQSSTVEPIEAEGASYLGEYVCHSGLHTGTHCGYTTQIDVENEEAGTGNIVYHLVTVHPICAYEGDSGGPVWAGHVALGIVVTGNQFPEEECGATMGYVNIIEADESMQMRVSETRDGARPIPETLNEDSAVELTATSATLLGEVNPNGLSTNKFFIYGPTTEYGSSSEVSGAGSGWGYVPVRAEIRGLTPGTTYHFRLAAENSAGGAESEQEMQFTTPTGPPIVTTGGAISLGSGGTTLHGKINPQGTDTHYYFEWGTNTEYGHKVPVSAEDIGSGTTNVEVSQTITGLEFGTQYHYRLVGEYNGGTKVFGEDRAFTLTPGWTVVETPNPESSQGTALSGVSCTASTECTAVGYSTPPALGGHVTLAERWNGTKWQIQSTQNPSGARTSNLLSVSCPSAVFCMAVGSYSPSSSSTAPLVELWNGGEWEMQTPANPEGSLYTEINGVSCTSATACTMVGWYETSSKLDVTLAERWNGTKWEAQSTTNPGPSDSYLESVSCYASNGCVAAGYYVNSSGTWQALSESWNGTKWETQSAVTPETSTYTILNGISCTSVSACSASGHYKTSSETFAPLAERWNGSKWELQTVSLPESTHSYFRGISCSGPSACIAVGEYEISSNTYSVLAEVWNGTKWEVQYPSNFEGTRDSYFEGISCTSASSCTASGRDQNKSGESVSLAESYFRGVPTVVTKPATSVAEASATLNGTVNPNGTSTTYHFEYGKTTAYGSNTPVPSENVGAGSVPIEKSKAVTGLEPETTYHYRIVAENGEGSADGEDKTFQTESSTAGQLKNMAVTDPFNSSTSAISNFSSGWSALGWSAGSVPKGEDRSSGWGPTNAYSTINGAYYAPTISDVGSGIADVATMATNPELESRYFSLWLDMSTPSSTRSGYELTFTDVSSGHYEVKLSKWVSGTQTTLATKSSYAFANGNSFALVDHGSTVSAWTNTGSGFNQLLSASDSTFEGGHSGVEGSGNITRLTNFKVGELLAPVANTNAALEALSLKDSFATNESPLSDGGAFAALSWDNGTSGHNTGQVSSGWGPYDAYSTINGAYWQKTSFADTGAGDAISAKLSNNPEIASRYFALWLNMPNPASARSGYELRFKETSAGVYEVVLAKWASGTETVLASKTGYSFVKGSLFALDDNDGTVSAWTKTGSEYTQLLSASDSTYTSGYTGIEGSGNITRLKEFKSGPLPPL